ncbi:MAG: response regulator [Bacteroidota bacterium]
MEVRTRFVVIDDDKLNNKICTATLEKLAANADVKTFIDPLLGFDYIAQQDKATGDDATVVFLDINMPTLNGWEFLARFDLLDEAVKKRVKLYILSSSVDKRDIDRARSDKNVVHYLVKPLTRETIRLITYSQNR